MNVRKVQYALSAHCTSLRSKPPIAARNRQPKRLENGGNGMKWKTRWLLPALAALLASLTGCKDDGNGNQTVQTASQTAAAKADGLQAGQAGRTITQEEIANKKLTVPKAYSRFFEKSREGAIIPALMQDYVPQGMTYLQPKDWLIMTSYSLHKQPSLLAVVDRESGRLVKSFFLYNPNNTAYTGHAGGVAASGAYIWISSGSKLHALQSSKLADGADGSRLVFEQAVPVETNGSFVTYADGMLWVGEFARSDYKTKDSHKLKARDGTPYSAWVAGYKLDAQTGLIAARGKTADGAYIPDSIIAIPDEIQGMDIAGSRVFLSRSYGRNNPSHLFIYENPLQDAPHAQVTIGDVQVPLWFLDGKNLADTFVMPPASEGIVSAAGALHILYESGMTDMRKNGAYPVDRLRVIDLNEL
jgi:hypothetical protein